MYKRLSLIIMLFIFGTVHTQHCRLDGYTFLVMDIKNETTKEPVPGLTLCLSVIF
ncbi:MAG: hypothetical protein ABIN67_14565 [Ferruginibacter sp.]